MACSARLSSPSPSGSWRLFTGREWIEAVRVTSNPSSSPSSSASGSKGSVPVSCASTNTPVLVSFGVEHTVIVHIEVRKEQRPHLRSTTAPASDVRRAECRAIALREPTLSPAPLASFVAMGMSNFSWLVQTPALRVYTYTLKPESWPPHSEAVPEHSGHPVSRPCRSRTATLLP